MESSPHWDMPLRFGKGGSKNGRLYDKMGDIATGIVKYILPQGIPCELLI